MAGGISGSSDLPPQQKNNETEHFHSTAECRNISFQRITGFPRGTLFALLSDAYSFDVRCAEFWGGDWRAFDDFFYDNPHIADRCGFVTVFNGKAIGFASWDPRHAPEYMEIGHNCIASAYKGHGYGVCQMREAVRRISEKKPDKIIVTTSEIMIPAQRMYASAGFRKIGERKNDHFSGKLIDYEMSLHFEIHELKEDDLRKSLFDSFNRHQIVTECWRRENGAWVLKPIAFVEEWNRSDLEVFREGLRETIRSGGTAFGAFAAEHLIGIASLKNKFFGTDCRYLELKELHVSFEWRGRGIGRKLFHRICEAARKRGADRLYISAHSSKESQAFYRAMGCREAEEYNPVIAAAEPCDCQLEFDLYGV